MIEQYQSHGAHAEERWYVSATLGYVLILANSVVETRNEMDIRNNSVKSSRRLLGAVHSPITDTDSGHGVSSSEDSADSVKPGPGSRRAS